MSRLLWSFLAAALVAVAAPPSPAVGHEHSPGYAYGYDSGSEDRADDFGWMIVTDENTSVSDMGGLESLDELRDRFGSNFLYFRDGDDHYVVRDQELIDRAERAGRDIKIYGKELGMLARAKVHGAFGSRKSAQKSAQKMAVIGRRQAELGREIARRSMNGESTERLERELEQLSEDMEVLQENLHAGEATASESRELEQKSEAMSKRLQRAVREAEQEMRDILHDAKARHLAKRVS
jgi:hypothetical protein